MLYYMVYWTYNNSRCFNRYYTVPPEEPNCHLSAEIVSQMSKEFDIERFAAEEKMMIDNFEEETANKETIDPVLIASSGPVASAMEVDLQKQAVSQILYIYICRKLFLLRFSCRLSYNDNNFCSKLRYKTN